MAKATLIIMAAGIGSRFGEGIKQLAPVGPNGEIIMDYSIYDAIEAGFDKIVFVIRKELEKNFKEAIGNRIEKVIDVTYAYQEVTEIPEKYKGKFSGRQKPWGTGQAILCCKNLVDSPFLVINADDYYGKQAYVESYDYLTNKDRDKDEICMVGFTLKNTLSDNGTVTRGICKMDEYNMLCYIQETKNIAKSGSGAVIQTKAGDIAVDKYSPVSMNMWGISHGFFDILEKGFDEFLEGLAVDDPKSEYLLPIIIGDLLDENKVKVRVLESRDKWFGVTYKEDKETVINEITNLVKAGVYPHKLYE